MSFIENWRYPLPQATNGERVGSAALDEDTSLQMIALTDTGQIAACTFGHPDEFIGTKLETAGDELMRGKKIRALAHIRWL
ncbi:hypothetical protein [Nocardia sp. NPDC049707]|uniref:hypothetical protein n=1 Tax=Nocardia sp. NPDC049707 TaxID=3154735 RepID=UPI00343B9C2A